MLCCQLLFGESRASHGLAHARMGLDKKAIQAEPKVICAECARLQDAYREATRAYA
jgi:hypothetical protein